jgi:arylsulfatase A-like enzyme
MTASRFLPLAFLGLTLVAPAQINIAFHNGAVTRDAMTTRPDGSVVATSTDTWNNPTNNGGEGTSFSGFALNDASGASTGATMAVTSGYTGYNGNGWGSGTQDAVMMEGWYGFRNTESISVAKLPAYFSSEYSVIIYGDSNATGRTMNYTVDDGTTSVTKTIQDSGTFSGTFEDGVNFVSFTGLTGTSLTITGNPGAGDSRSAVNGLILLPGTLPVPPEIVSFTASDHYVTPGSSVILNWVVTGADTLTLDPGALDVIGTTSTSVTVNETTTYTLTATNADGDTTATVRVGAGPPRPNLLVFLVDDMGPHDTSVPFNQDAGGNPVAYNFNSFYQTPNMESLAASGMRFTSAYAQSVCSPTRCGIMTGRNSARHAVTDWVGSTVAGSPANWRSAGIDGTDTTLPKLLQSGGYRTIHVGKAHFANSSVNVTDLGFDVNVAGSHWGHPWSGYIGTPAYGGMPGMGAYDGSLFLTNALTIEANQALEDAVDDGTPFFLHMAFYAVHAPFTTNPDATGDYSAATGSTHTKFATMIEGMDIAVGQIRQKLVDLGVAEDTLIVFLGDNGSDSPALSQDGLPSGIYNDFPMRGKKGSKWEGGIRVPFIATWAAADGANSFQQAIPIPADSIETDIVTSWDLSATLLDVAGLPGTTDFGEDSHSIVPYFRGTPGSHRPQEVIIHYPHNHRSDFFSLIRQGDMKLIYNYQSNTHQLYNLAADPTESNNLAAAQPETVMRMARALAQGLDATWGARGPLIPTISTTAPNGNVVSIPDNPGVDVDDDGLADTTEDPDLDGLVDPGETDPDNDNTDGDRTPDGDEVRTGTDPLDPSSDFTGVLTPEPGGGFTITWPSKPGASYEIRTSDDLADWPAPPLATVPAADPGTTTTYILPATTDPRRFYRVGLTSMTAL